MTAQPTRNYTRLAVSIIVAALIVGSVLYVSISPSGNTFTKTDTVTTTLTSTDTPTTTSSSATTCLATINSLLKPSNGTTTTSYYGVIAGCKAEMSLTGFSLCASDCEEPGPHISGTVNIESDSPLSTLIFFINDTYESSINLYNFRGPSSIPFAEQLNGSAISIEAGHSYSVGFAAFYQSGVDAAVTTEVTATGTISTASSCITSPGQPQGAYLRVVHDSNSTPIPGVGVTATPLTTNGCTSAPLRFTANGTEWYSLGVTNVYGYQITVSYLRHDYNLTMTLGLSIWTCETLYLPSGNTSMVTSTESSCASPPPTTFITGNGVLKFEVQLNPIAVTVGQQISFSCELVNVSNQTQTVVVRNPICVPSIYTQGGQQVWAYTPSATNAVQIVPSGGTFGLTINIPTWELQVGQNYILSSYPDVLTDSNPKVFFGQQLQVNATITVG